MKRRIVRTIILGTIAAGFVMGASRMQAQDAKPAYQNIAPLEQYLMADRDAEIALARSAAPESISNAESR